MKLSEKEANRLFYAVKGHMIPVDWSERDVIKMIEQYTVRLWNNNERIPTIEEKFEKAWKEVS